MWVYVHVFIVLGFFVLNFPYSHNPQQVKEPKDDLEKNTTMYNYCFMFQ